MNYRTIEKIKIVAGLSAMAIIVAAWLYPVFFLMVNANKTASEYSQGSKTEIIWGTSIFENAIKAWNKGIGDGVFNSLLYGFVGSGIAVFVAFIAAFGIVRLKMKNGLLWFLLIYSGTVFPFQMYLLPLLIVTERHYR